MVFRKYATYLPFLIGLLAGLYFISLNVTGASFAYLPGDYIDGRFNNYLLEHAYRFFAGLDPSFWNAPFMYPEENVITYSDNLLGSAPFYALFRILGADREGAFQFWYILVTAFNYAGCYLLLQYLFKNSYASVCGALVFAFSMALHSQMGHAQTFPRYPAPLAILFLLKFGEQLNPRYFFLALVLLVYQMYCGIYLGFLLAVPFGIINLALFYTQRQQVGKQIKQKKWLIKMLMGAFTNVALLLPLLLPYFARAKQTGFYSFEQVLASVPTLGSYFFSWKGSLWWDFLSETCIAYPAFWDHEIFAGGFALFSFLVLVMIFVVSFFYKGLRDVAGLSPAVKLLLVAGSATFIIFLRVGDVSLYRIVYAVPGFGSMRALQRIINIELVFFAVALAWVVHRITKRRNWLSAIAALLLCALIIADNYVNKGFIHQKEKAVSEQRIQKLVVKMKGAPLNSIVSYEPDTLLSSPADYQLDAMLAAQSLGLYTMNGYSATSPGGYGPYWVKPGEESRRIWLERKGRLATSVFTIK